MHIHAVYVNDISHAVVMNWLTGGSRLGET